MNVGLIGCGQWGANILRDLTGLGCHVRVYDPACSDESFRSVASFGQAFVVATPAVSHAECVRSLPDRPVFVEKPLALSVQDAESVSHVAMVGHLMLYHPGFLELRKRLEGVITGISSERLGGRREEGCDAFFALSVHDVAMAEVLSSCPVSLKASFDEGPSGNVRRFTVNADRRYTIDHDSLLVDDMPQVLEWHQPLKAELSAFLSHVTDSTPVLSDGAFGLKVVRRLSRMSAVA